MVRVPCVRDFEWMCVMCVCLVRVCVFVCVCARELLCVGDRGQRVYVCVCMCMSVDVCARM